MVSVPWVTIASAAAEPAMFRLVAIVRSAAAPLMSSVPSVTDTVYATCPAFATVATPTCAMEVCEFAAGQLDVDVGDLPVLGWGTVAGLLLCSERIAIATD